jgi:hypothetical protein
VVAATTVSLTNLSTGIVTKSVTNNQGLYICRRWGPVKHCERWPPGTGISLSWRRILLSNNEADHLRRADLRNNEVIFPVINGQEVNKRTRPKAWALGPR